MRRNKIIARISIMIVTILISITIISTALVKEERFIFQLSGKNKNFEAADVQYRTILLDTQGGGTESVRYVYIKPNQVSDTKLYVRDSGGNYIGYNTGDKIPNVIPTKTNGASGESYKFKGYYTAQNGGGEQIIDEQGRITGNGIYDWLHSSSTAMVYTYASWESVSYKTILLDTQGGGTESVRYVYIKPNQVSDTKLYVRDSGGNYIGYNTGDKIPNVIPTKTNGASGESYKFKGYYTAQNGGGEQIIDEQGRITGNGIYDWLHSSSTAMVYTYASWEKDSGSESETKPGTGTEDGTGSESETKPGTGTEDGTGSESETKPGTGTEDGTGSGSETKPGTGTEDGTGSGSETKPGTGTEDGTGSGSETKPGTGTEDETGSGTEAKPRTELKTGTTTGTSTVTKESILGSKDTTLASTVIPKTGNSTILIIGIMILTGFAIICYKKSKI